MLCWEKLIKLTNVEGTFIPDPKLQNRNSAMKAATLISKTPVLVQGF